MAGPIIAAIKAVGAWAAKNPQAWSFLKTAATYTIASGLDALERKKSKSNLGDQLQVKSGAVTQVQMLMGRTATAGVRVRDLMRSGKNNGLGTTVTVLSGCGECGVIESIKWGDDTIIFNASGGVSSGKYANKIWKYEKSGSWTQTYINISSGSAGHESGAQPSDWRTTDRALGCMHVLLGFKLDDPVWQDNWHDPIFIVKAENVNLIDPRTGVASTTWAQKQNPAVWYYNSAQKIESPNGKHIAGLGWAASQIDIAAISYWANICDANSWTISGVYNVNPSNEEDTLQKIAAAGGARPVTRGGLLSVSYSAPQTSVATFTEDDFVTKPVFSSAKNVREMPNAIVPTFLSEANNWQPVAGSAVTNSAFLTADKGYKRSEALNFDFVSNPTQVGQLAAYALVNAREPFAATLQCKATKLYSADVGDCITLTGFGFNNYKLYVTNKSIDTLTDIVTYQVVTETDSKHSFALGQSTTPPNYTEQTRIDGDYVPDIDPADWTVINDVISGNGTELPIIRVTGTSNWTGAAGIVLRYKKDGIGEDWLGSRVVSTSSISEEINIVTPQTDYIIGLSYLNKNGIEGAIEEFSPVTTDDIVVSSAADASRFGYDDNTNGMLANNNWQDLASVTLNAPTGYLIFTPNPYLAVTSASGTLDAEFQITDGTTVYATQGSQNLATGGTPSAIITDDLFSAAPPSVTAGVKTFKLQVRRTAGSGNVTAFATQFRVQAISN